MSNHPPLSHSFLQTKNLQPLNKERADINTNSPTTPEFLAPIVSNTTTQSYAKPSPRHDSNFLAPMLY
ncbi:hypothetical protein BO71DRAFT_434290 [Aspergillus ellipticus CBS 707.79]|uniref:Uncharacterized protein n=1 Tax=Aspergillus ellipticus CBS 707.79 TaxID=1448320 RepID=A0A319CY82_9EURO|nr:hypothetical protein BO71DRAFT_434290 [Aspergillus ellipticus CBS 707.79]